MAKGKAKGRGIPANPTGRGLPATSRGAQVTHNGKPVSPAVARSRGGAAAGQGHGK